MGAFCEVVGTTGTYNVGTMTCALVLFFSLFLTVWPTGDSDGDDGVDTTQRSLAQSACSGQPDYTVPEMMKKLDFFVYYFIILALTGGGFAFSNNLGQMVKA